MAKIYKNKVSNNRFVYISDDTPTVEHNIQTTETVLRYKFINVETQTPIIEFQLDLDTIKNNNRFSDQTWYGISDTILSNERTQTEVTLVPTDIICLLDFSSIDKKDSLVNVYTGEDITKTYKTPFRFFVPSKSSTFTDYIFQVALPVAGDIDNTVTVETNAPNTVNLTETYNWKNAFANITASSTGTTVAGEQIEVNVVADNTSIETLYLEPIVGILDRTKVKLTNGVGKFNILTSTLETGDVVEVKIGYKTFTNKTTFTKVLS
jgi:hypothetical protein